MRFPSKNYILLFILWIVLMILGIGALKINLSSEISPSPSWLMQHIINKENDTAIKNLNMSMPSQTLYQDLVKAQQDLTTPFNPEVFINYYTQITQIMPAIAESYNVLGFCYYRQGLKEKAFNAFQKSFYINPNYFYNGLNLGIMYLEANKHNHAIRIFEHILHQDPTVTLNTLASSKIYQDILGANRSYNVIEHLKENYQALELFLREIKNNPNFPVNNFRNHIEIL